MDFLGCCPGVFWGAVVGRSGIFTGARPTDACVNCCATHIYLWFFLICEDLNGNLLVCGINVALKGHF